MKVLFAFLIAFSTSGFAQNTKKAAPAVATSGPATTYKVDTSASKIEWEGKKVLGKHNGTINIKSGNLVFKGPELVGGEIVVDMNSLSVTDLKPEEGKEKLEGHLKSDDFFAVDKHPEARLVIKSSKTTPKGVEIKGDLTMKGKTNPVTFLATPKKIEGDVVSGTTTFAVDRTKWGIQYGSASFIKGLGDKAIDNNFTLTINVTAKKQ